MAVSFQASHDFLLPTGHIPSFSTTGLGALLASSLSASLLSDRSRFPFLTRGKTLLLVADFGGHHQKQHFDTYTFLILDLIKNYAWLTWQRHFRQTILPCNRRMSFKALNDGMCRRALVPFLRAATDIEGCLVQFAVSKNGESLLNSASQDEVGSELLTRWKARVQERLLRVLHFSALLLSGLSAPNQDILWIIDEDDIAANVPLLTDLTKLFGRIASSYCLHPLGHLRCGTTSIADDGSLVMEDLAAIADLATGALGELCTGLVVENLFPRNGLITPLPKNLSWKTKLIGSWMAAQRFRVQRHTTVLELYPGSQETRTSTLGWKAYESNSTMLS